MLAYVLQQEVGKSEEFLFPQPSWLFKNRFLRLKVTLECTMKSMLGVQSDGDFRVHEVHMSGPWRVAFRDLIAKHICPHLVLCEC